MTRKLPLQWIRIWVDHFNNPECLAIDSLPDADCVHYIFFRIVLFAGKCNDGGRIWLTPDMPFCAETFSEVVNRPVGRVKYAISILAKFGLLASGDFNDLKVQQWSRYLAAANKEREQARIRMRNMRKKKRLDLIENTNDVTDDSRNKSVTSYADVTLFGSANMPVSNDLQLDVTHVRSLEEKRREKNAPEGSAFFSPSPTSSNPQFVPSPAAKEILYRLRHSFGTLSKYEIEVSKIDARSTTVKDWVWIEQFADKKWSGLIAEIRRSAPLPPPEVAANAARNPDGSAHATPLPKGVNRRSPKARAKKLEATGK